MGNFDRVIEEKIQKAIKNGDFDNLKGQGKPLIFEDDRHVPEHLRMAYKILKNSGYLPEEMLLKKDIANLEELLAKALPEEKTVYRSQIQEKITRFNMMMEAKKRQASSGV